LDLIPLTPASMSKPAPSRIRRCGRWGPAWNSAACLRPPAVLGTPNALETRSTRCHSRRSSCRAESLLSNIQRCPGPNSLDAGLRYKRPAHNAADALTRMTAGGRRKLGPLEAHGLPWPSPPILAPRLGRRARRLAQGPPATCVQAHLPSCARASGLPYSGPVVHRSRRWLSARRSWSAAPLAGDRDQVGELAWNSRCERPEGENHGRARGEPAAPHFFIFFCGSSKDVARVQKFRPDVSFQPVVSSSPHDHLEKLELPAGGLPLKAAPPAATVGASMTGPNVRSPEPMSAPEHRRLPPHNLGIGP